MSDLIEQVSSLEKKYIEMRILTCEILATLMLEHNRKHFNNCPSRWTVQVEAWHAKYQEIAEEKDRKIKQ